MKIKDVINVTGGNTNVMIYGIDKNDQYIALWKGHVDDIDFSSIPYGDYEVEHLTVVNEEDILQLYFEYPELDKEQKDIIGKETVGYPYPTEWIEHLFIKYRNLDKIRGILTKSRDEVYNEISVKGKNECKYMKNGMCGKAAAFSGNCKMPCSYCGRICYVEENNSSNFKILNGESIFIQPDSPFLLLTEDVDGNVSYYWWNNENELQADAVERRGAGERIICAIEISSCRDVEIPPEYTVDDFIEEVNSAYDEAKERGFDSIVLVVETDTEQTYCINDTEDGFQCDEFDYYFDDLNSIAETLFNEKIIGKPTEIRIE